MYPKFDISKIVCISVGSCTLTQLFSFAMSFGIDFTALAEMKAECGTGSGQLSGKVWLDIGLMEVVALERNSIFYEYECRGGSQKKRYTKNFEMLTQYDGIGYMLDLQAMSVSKSPKIAKTPENIVFYSYYSNKGWNLKIDSFDRILTGEQKENTKYLTKMMRDAIDGEDYETAAILRDKIAKICRR